MAWLLSGVASLLAGCAAVGLWHWRRKSQNWPRRKPDYVWAFIHGGILYVMAALIIGHNWADLSYSELLENGFGDTQVNIAFIGALFEAMWALWDMWSGNELMPPPGGLGVSNDSTSAASRR